VRYYRRILPFLFVLPFGVLSLSAQSSVNFMVGGGYAHDNASSSSGLDSVGLGACSPVGSATSDGGTCSATSGLNNFFLGFDGDIMLFKHLGVGADVSFTPARSNYVNTTYGELKFRQTFYDINAIFAPFASKHAALYLEGGIGAAHLGLAINQSTCVGSACTSAVSPVASSNHFQIHGAIGVSLYATEHFFIRPQFDMHYVPNFTTQPGFNSDFVPAFMVWVGYSFGER
jgi:Outer membrane protein beta-barrel domain